MSDRKVKVMIAKCGCDIHERGALTMLNVFRDEGFEVIYTGRYQSEEGVAKAAIDEDVDIVAVSDLSGSLVIICRKIKEALLENGGEDIKMMCGGLLSEQDEKELYDMGLFAVMGTGSPVQDSVDAIKKVMGIED